VPFRRSAEGFERAAASAVGPGADLLLTHQAVSGCAVPGFVFRPGKPQGTVAPEQLPPGVPWLLGGHLHPRQQVPLGHATTVYPGATARTAPREGPEQKGYARWDFGREVSWRYVDLPSRDYTMARTADDIGALEPGQLVHIARSPERRELFHAARERGAWVVGRAADEAPRTRPIRPEQLRLFEP
jgi:DNA repair exonuclease SbcCD nuclease subunit